MHDQRLRGWTAQEFGAPRPTAETVSLVNFGALLGGSGRITRGSGWYLGVEYSGDGSDTSSTALRPDRPKQQLLVPEDRSVCLFQIWSLRNCRSQEENQKSIFQSRSKHLYLGRAAQSAQVAQAA
jgi:hypothetical protein